MTDETFQYKTIEVQHNKLENEINAVAKDGWRVVGVTSLTDFDVIVVFEKRK
jgi:hypothetical protein